MLYIFIDLEKEEYFFVYLEMERYLTLNNGKTFE